MEYSFKKELIGAISAMIIIILIGSISIYYQSNTIPYGSTVTTNFGYKMALKAAYAKYGKDVKINDSGKHGVKWGSVRVKGADLFYYYIQWNEQDYKDYLKGKQ